MVHAFADDSRGDLVVTAALVLREERVAHAESILAESKLATGLPAEERLHCKTMFVADARRGTAWQSLSPDAIYKLVRAVCGQLKDISEQPLLAILDPRQFPEEPVTPTGPIRRRGPQEIASLGYGGLWAGLSTRYAVCNFRMWVDPDPTRIDWGAGRRQADRTRGIYLDLGPGTEPPKLEPEVVISETKPPLLEVADIYAYTALQVHRRRGGWAGGWFAELHELIGAEQAIFQGNPGPTKWVDTREG